MVFSLGLFVFSWLTWLIFADKRLFFVITPTCYLAVIFDLAFDVLTEKFQYWHYKDTHPIHEILMHYLDSFGVYFVVTYLFIQTLPSAESIFNIIKHIFYWTILAIIIEFIYLKTGVFVHDKGWNLYYSFFADLILFLIFYFHHRIRSKYAISSEKA